MKKKTCGSMFSEQMHYHAHPPLGQWRRLCSGRCRQFKLVEIEGRLVMSTLTTSVQRNELGNIVVCYKPRAVVIHDFNCCKSKLGKGLKKELSSVLKAFVFNLVVRSLQL